MIYKVSYVVTGAAHSGAIINQDTAPQVGEIVELGHEMFEVIEVMDLLPPQGDFAYLHVTCRPLTTKSIQHQG
ncbi:MAG: hypothetical protein JXA33_20440 [Anaerolineae bacterium]|nr:hypothetical protein [Anaerolineae bacterium]